MPLTFHHPWGLLALLALPAAIFAARTNRSGIEPGRSAVATGLRALIILALALALADAHYNRTTRRTTTIFLLDRSWSIPPDAADRAIEYLREQLRRVPEGDRAGVIVFGGEPMIEVLPSSQPALDQVRSVVTRHETNIAAAIRLAMASFPSGEQRRIVLISDGNETLSSAVAEAEAAAAHKVPVDILPVRYDRPGEVWIEDVHIPPEIQIGEPFDVAIVIHSNQAGPATVRVYRNDTPVLQQEVQLSGLEVKFVHWVCAN